MSQSNFLDDRLGENTIDLERELNALRSLSTPLCFDLYAELLVRFAGFTASEALYTVWNSAKSLILNPECLRLLTDIARGEIQRIQAYGRSGFMLKEGLQNDEGNWLGKSGLAQAQTQPAAG